MATKYTQEQIKFLKGKRVMVATPCYGGMTTSLFTQSMLQLQTECRRYDVDMILLTIANESLITRARNDLAYYFLTHADSKGYYDYIMFIDADIHFDGDYVMRLIVHDKDIATGAYPMKVINYNNIENKALPVEKLVNLTTEYVINVKVTDPEKAKLNQIEMIDGLIEVFDAGTGFMLIKREVLEKMKKAYPEIKYVKDMKSIKPDGSIDATPNEQYAFFDTSIDEESRRYLSEDYTFCRRWQNLGGKIWTDPEIVLNHVGTHTFRGRKLVSNE
jgi:cellulose synthase/poly-beta-1,6-N-acetylglucosamine synthase-like glycosyltransferase